MLKIINIQKSYGGQSVLQSVSFDVNDGEKVGLVGANGSGKSTVLGIIAGSVRPDKGLVRVEPGRKIAYLEQVCEPAARLSVGEFLCGSLLAAKRMMMQIEQKMSRQAESPQLLESYCQAVDRFELAGGYKMESHLERILAGLDMEPIELISPLSTVSGGQLTRIGLARILVQDADILLLDEPTNDLDLEAIEWLESWLKDVPATFLVVSHDRSFLDNVTSRTLAMEPQTGGVRSYSGNYSWYRQTKKKEESRMLREYREQQRQVKRLRANIASTRQQALLTERSTTNDHLRRKAKKVAAKAKAREKRLGRTLSETHRINKPHEVSTSRIEFCGRRLHRSGVLSIEDGAIGAGGSLLMSGINVSLEGSERVAIIGANGSGKTMLLKVILKELELAEGVIRRPESLLTGYLPQNQTIPSSDSTVLEYFMTGPYQLRLPEVMRSGLPDRSLCRTFLHRFLFTGDDVYKRLSQLSRGELRKLTMASLTAYDPDLLVLDEPTNHLDLPTIDNLESSLVKFKGALVLVSHDRQFLRAMKPDIIWKAEKGRLRKIYPEEFFV